MVVFEALVMPPCNKMYMCRHHEVTPGYARVVGLLFTFTFAPPPGSASILFLHHLSLHPLVLKHSMSQGGLSGYIVSLRR